MTRRFLVADLLCGAGGSSTGCQRACDELGLRMELVCVNHWPVAIETHQKNHPEARHYVEDIATVRPSALVPEGRLDLLMASPTCTHHSVARGGKPTSDQQRSDPWHINTWLTELDVRCFIIENVWEFLSWGPVDHKTGKPIASRKGEYFRAWTDALRAIGYQLEWRKLNAANYGDATTRQRFIMKGRKDRKPIVWAPITHFKKSDGLLLLPGLQTWRPARDIIDWQIRGKSIFSRKKPLAPKTLARIYAGAVKFGWPEPFLVILRNHMAGQSVDGPVPTIAANGTHIGLAQPVVINVANGNEPHERSPNDRRALDVNAPLGTIHAGGGNFGVAEPLILSQQNSGAPRSADEPLPTITTGGSGTDNHPGCARAMLAEPVIINGRKNNQPKGVSSDPIPTLDTKGGVWLVEPTVINMKGESTASSIDAPLPTQTSHAPHLYVAEPFVLNRHGDNGGTRAHPVEEPLPTSDCRGAGYVVEPFILSRQADGAPRSTDEPMCTNTAQHSPVLVAPYYGSGSGETCKTAEEPLDTVTGTARFGVVVPVTHAGGENRALDINEDPLPTVTCAARGEQALAEGIVVPVFDGQHYDILFRMLEPHELAAAMGFTTEDAAYEFAGTKTEQIKQIGNAVSVAMMKAEVKATLADLVPKQKPKNQQVNLRSPSSECGRLARKSAA